MNLPPSIQVLLDVSVGHAVGQWLSTHGYDIKNVRDIDPRMSDRFVLDLAVLDKRLVITMDKDFGDLVYNSRRPHAGVLLLRLEEAGADEKIRIVQDILEKYAGKLQGNFSVYKDGKLRIKTKLNV